MHVISRKKLLEQWVANPEVEKPLRNRIKLAEGEDWRRFSDVRASLKGVDQVGKFTVFNILGNRFRLICVIHFDRGKVYVRQVLTHSNTIADYGSTAEAGAE